MVVMKNNDNLPRIISQILPQIKEELKLNMYHMFIAKADGYTYYVPEKGDDFIFAMKWSSYGKVQLKDSNWISLPHLHFLFRQEFGENIIENF